MGQAPGAPYLRAGGGGGRSAAAGSVQPGGRPGVRGRRAAGSSPPPASGGGWALGEGGPPASAGLTHAHMHTHALVGSSKQPHPPTATPLLALALFSF